jgi:hypothetical protein
MLRNESLVACMFLDSQSYKRILFPLDYWASDITARSFSAHIGKHKLGVTCFLFLLLNKRKKGCKVEPARALVLKVEKEQRHIRR